MGKEYISLSLYTGFKGEGTVRFDLHGFPVSLSSPPFLTCATLPTLTGKKTTGITGIRVNLSTESLGVSTAKATSNSHNYTMTKKRSLLFLFFEYSKVLMRPIWLCFTLFFIFSPGKKEKKIQDN